MVMFEWSLQQSRAVVSILPRKVKIHTQTHTGNICFQRLRCQEIKIHPIVKCAPQVVHTNIKPRAVYQKVSANSHACTLPHTVTHQKWACKHRFTHTLALGNANLIHINAPSHAQSWLYFGTLLCGKRCEGLEGLDGVDFAVNLQSLCTLTAASLIICGGPPITVENRGWDVQKIYHSPPPSISHYTALSNCEGFFLLALTQGGGHNSHFFEFI